ncbi:MAG: hypothetical protein RIC30_03925 [Marinoscillum sp.]|uniref:hypothetical protein n=1 Tax=Marinoscillum sp. TaxID=2024838 RepID=UPI0033034F25
MKTINTGNYIEYLNDRAKKRLQDVSTYLYLGLILIAEAIFFYNGGWERATSISLLLTTGFMFVWMAIELIFVLIRNKTFNRNLWLTYILVGIVLIPLNYLVFDERQRYWSFVSGVIFLIPVLVSVVVSKIASWLD